DMIQDQREPCVVAGLPSQSYVTQVFARTTVVAVAVRGKPVGADNVIYRAGPFAGGSAGFCPISPGTVTAGCKAARQLRRLSTFFCKPQDNHAERVAMQRRERAPQNYNPVNGRDIDVCCLAVAI